jgi:hypothetical protein
MKRTIYFVSIILLVNFCLFSSQSKKRQTVDEGFQTCGKLNKIIIRPENNRMKENIPPDSLLYLLDGTYKFPENIKNQLPANASNYFRPQKFPFYLPDSLTIDYYCERTQFKLKDFYIFNKLNKYPACEYIALIDTTKFIKIIAQQCVAMENWISLYVFNKIYKIIDFELLIIAGSDEIDNIPLRYEGNKIAYNDYVDTLKYSKGTYNVYRSDIYMITDTLGTEIKDIGSQKVKSLNVDQNGKIQSKERVIFKKKYMDLYNALNK